VRVCDRVMSLSAVTAHRLLVVLMLLGLVQLPSRTPVDAVPLHTSCFQGYFNTFRCAPVIRWFATYIISSCDLKCKATGKYNEGACLRKQMSCLLGKRKLYVCECSGSAETTEQQTTR